MGRRPVVLMWRSLASPTSPPAKIATSLVFSMVEEIIFFIAGCSLIMGTLFNPKVENSLKILTYTI
jgi:hypothetical protein